jgi:hypothetical protein
MEQLAILCLHVGWTRNMAKKSKKLSLKQAAGKLTAIAEAHLAHLPEEEQDLRVAIFSRSVAKMSRNEKPGTPSSRRRTAGSRR